MTPKSSYQVMTSVLSNYQPTLEEKRSVSSFFLCRYLSNNPMAIHIGNAFNRYHNLIPVETQYDIAKSLLKGKIKFIQFPKKPKNEDITIKNICRFYKVNIDTAHTYFNFMPDSERLRFETLYSNA